MTVSARFVGRSASVGEARRFTTDALAGLSGEVIDAAALMVSELATNALVHADADFEVTIDITETAVSVEVTDAGRGVPTLRWPEDSDPHGRGLHIVEQLSDRWGTRAGSDGSDGAGKSVWFTIDRAPTPARASRAGSSQADPSGSRPWRPVLRGQRLSCRRGRSHDLVPGLRHHGLCRLGPDDAVASIGRCGQAGAVRPRRRCSTIRQRSST
jgi:anti-sigma regulatory factor (Ser/Thr protein kinase)